MSGLEVLRRNRRFSRFLSTTPESRHGCFGSCVLDHLGIGIDTALPAPRSAIQIVSPAGSTAVGVLSPSLMTVTLALSPLTVITEILPLPFSARRSLPLAARMPSGPFTG